ncbi:helix-turn-helix domain-containing protein [Halobacillus campisalis]|uniref:Helix-turn-helix domain-containing protein n=1 Tax=Halobacillus campisalis TaxID=435909 RepID=A0ABW2K1F4_9BACI|nr:helix-turn-helix transcriptional regulator [Halobacillus campisalis]
MGIGSLIQNRRKELKLTQEELSNGICSITYISKVENNNIQPHKEILDYLLERLSIDPKDLALFDSETMNEKARNVYKAMESPKTYSQAKELVPDFMDCYYQNTNPATKATCSIVIAYFNIKEKKYKEAIPYIEFVDNHFELIPKDLQYNALKTKGFYFHQTGKLKDALNIYLQAEDYAKQQEIIDQELLYQLGMLHSKLNQFKVSNDYLSKALKAYNSLLNVKRIIECNMIIGINYSRQGTYNKAKEVFLTLLNNDEGTINQAYLSSIHHNLGIVFLYMDEMDTAINYFKEAMALKNKDEDKIYTLYYLAYINKHRENYDEMMDYLNRGINYSQNNLAMHYKFRIFKLNVLGKKQQLITLMENEILAYFKLTHPVVYQEILLLLAELHKGLSQYKKSTYYLEKYINLNQIKSRKEVLL